jgi:hypothetical protein
MKKILIIGSAVLIIAFYLRRKIKSIQFNPEDFDGGAYGI